MTPKPRKQYTAYIDPFSSRTSLTRQWLQCFSTRSVYFAWTIDVPLQNNGAARKTDKTTKTERESRAKQKYEATMNELMNGWVFKTEWHEQQQKQREEKSKDLSVRCLQCAHTDDKERNEKRQKWHFVPTPRSSSSSSLPVVGDGGGVKWLLVDIVVFANLFLRELKREKHVISWRFDSSLPTYAHVFEQRLENINLHRRLVEMTTMDCELRRIRRRRRFNQKTMDFLSTNRSRQ